MDVTSHKDTPSTGGKLRMIAILGTSVAGTVLAFVLLIHGAMNQHSRPVGHDDISLDISASGNQIVFNAAGAGQWDLYLFDLTTRRARRLAETPAYELSPSFSPDGERVVYAAGLPGDREDHIFVCSIHGGEVRQLTAADANDMSPKFSPGGTLVVFAREKTYNWGGLGSNWSGGS